MGRLIRFAKRYKVFLALCTVNVALLFLYPQKGEEALAISGSNLREMISFLPPIFLLLGLLDVWVSRETMMKYMGVGSGPKGTILAFIMGSAAAGPLYAAFPIAGILLKKGVRLFNVFVFVGAWSTTKIPLILFESTNLGFRYMLLRLSCNVVGILVIALLLERTLSPEKRTQIYRNAETL